MELQLLYSRILTLLRNEFIAVKWRVYLEEERHRLIIERGGGGGGHTRDRYGLDAIKLEEDALEEKREVDALSAPFDQDAGVKKESTSLDDPEIIESSHPKRKRLPVGWHRGDDDDDDDDDVGVWESNGSPDENESFDSPSKRKRSSNGDDGGFDGLSDDDDDVVVPAKSSDEYWTEADLGDRRGPRRKNPELRLVGLEAFCTICNKYFSSRNYLEKHSLKIHNVDIGDRKGDAAGAAAAKNGAAAAAGEEEAEDGTVDGGGPTNCDECDIAFPTASELTRHRRVIHPTTITTSTKKKKKIGDGEVRRKTNDDVNKRCFEYGCDGKAFSSASKLKNHQERIHGVTRRQHKCTECDEAFWTQKKRAEHFKAVHSGVKIACAHCDKQFTKRVNLNYHVDNVHSETLDPAALNQICDLCGRTFSSPESLYLHQIAKHRKKEDIPTRSPRKNRPPDKEGHPCPVCGKRFYHGRAYVKDKVDSGATPETAPGKTPDTAPGTTPETMPGADSLPMPVALPDSVPESAVEDICRCERGPNDVYPGEVISIKNHRKGQEKRASYSIEMKAQVILEAYKTGMTQEKVAKKFDINRSMVSTWLRDKDKIMDATRRASKKFSRLRPYTKHARLFELLQARLNATRLASSCLTDFPWLWAEARSLHAELKNNPEAMLCAHVVILFLKRYGVRIRVQPKYRKITREIYEPRMKRWHAELRERLIIRGSNGSDVVRHMPDHPYDRKWGKFPPWQRFAVDTCALPIYLSRSRVVDHYKVGENEESKDKICLQDPSHGLDRRHCSLMICMRGGEDGIEMPQPRLALIFRGGRRFGSEEKTLWSKDVDVYFQEKARVDSAIAAEWARNTLGKSLDKSEGKFVLFCDKSAALSCAEFEANVAERGGVIWRGLEDLEEGVSTASLWQPIEAGPAQLLKVLIGQAQRTWLENPENNKLWQGETKGFTAKDRRVLITHWAAQAWKKFVTGEYFQFRQNAWQKTGCLMTADGSDDHLIKPEDLGAEYAVPPPPGSAAFQSFLHFPISAAAAASNGAADFDATDEEVRASIDSLNGGDSQLRFPRPPPPTLPPHHHHPQQQQRALALGTVALGFNSGEEDPLMDKPTDRDFNHELVGRQLKILYEDGWASGKISYFNVRFGMMKVDFGEDADFVAPHDIDGIEVVLL